MQNTETNIIPIDELDDLQAALAARPKVGDKRECAGRMYYIGKNGNWIREDGKREAKPKKWREQRVIVER